MTYKENYILAILLGLSFCGCSSSDKESKNDKIILIGTWALDSISTPSGKYYKTSSETKTLTFKNETDYIFEWWNGDVGNTFTGKYFVLDNPKRGLKTISFVPDIQTADKDTIRIEYMNFDIVSINSKRLQVVDETEFIKSDSLPYKRFNKNYIYTKMK